MHTGFVQVGLKPEHRIGSYEYIRQIKKRMAEEMPELTPFFSTGSLVDAVVSMGAPAPIDVQVVGANLDADNQSRPGYRRQVARCRRRSPTSSCRRISTIRRCASISTACTPPSSG